MSRERVQLIDGERFSGFGLDAEVGLHHPLHGRMVLPVIGEVAHVLPREPIEDVVGEPTGSPDYEADDLGPRYGLFVAGSKGRGFSPLCVMTPEISVTKSPTFTMSSRSSFVASGWLRLTHASSKSVAAF